MQQYHKLFGDSSADTMEVLDKTTDQQEKKKQICSGVPGACGGGGGGGGDGVSDKGGGGGVSGKGGDDGGKGGGLFSQMFSPIDQELDTVVMKKPTYQRRLKKMNVIGVGGSSKVRICIVMGRAVQHIKKSLLGKTSTTH